MWRQLSLQNKSSRLKSTEQVTIKSITIRNAIFKKIILLGVETYEIQISCLITVPSIRIKLHLNERVITLCFYLPSPQLDPPNIFFVYGFSYARISVQQSTDRLSGAVKVIEIWVKQTQWIIFATSFFEVSWNYRIFEITLPRLLRVKQNFYLKELLLQ